MSNLEEILDEIKEGKEQLSTLTLDDLNSRKFLIQLIIKELSNEDIELTKRINSRISPPEYRGRCFKFHTDSTVSVISVYDQDPKKLSDKILIHSIAIIIHGSESNWDSVKITSDEKYCFPFLEEDLDPNLWEEISREEFNTTLRKITKGLEQPCQI